jgi:hypothetical protein
MTATVPPDTLPPMNEIPEDNAYAVAVRGRRTAATVLLFVAGAALFSRYLPFNWRESLPLLLGLGFIVWSALARVRGLLVPGGILVGVGVGALLRAEYGNAAFLLSLAGGFLLVAGLAAVLFGREKCWRWPLWPAAGLALAGSVQLAGPEARQWFHAAQSSWPYALIVVALFLFFTKPARAA